MDALLLSWQTAQTVASYAVRVDAMDERARRFYLRHDFLPFPKERLKLFFPHGGSRPLVCILGVHVASSRVL